MNLGDIESVRGGLTLPLLAGDEPFGLSEAEYFTPDDWAWLFLSMNRDYAKAFEALDKAGLLVTSIHFMGGAGDEWTMVCQATSAADAYRPPLKTPRPVAHGVESALLHLVHTRRRRTPTGPPGK